MRVCTVPIHQVWREGQGPGQGQGLGYARVHSAHQVWCEGQGPGQGRGLGYARVHSAHQVWREGQGSGQGRGLGYARVYSAHPSGVASGVSPILLMSGAARGGGVAGAERYKAAQNGAVCAVGVVRGVLMQWNALRRIAVGVER